MSSRVSDSLRRDLHTVLSEIAPSIVHTHGTCATWLAHRSLPGSAAAQALICTNTATPRMRAADRLAFLGVCSNALFAGAPRASLPHASLTRSTVLARDGRLWERVAPQ